VRAFEAIRAALPRTTGEIYNVGGGPENAISLVELMEDIEVLTGERIQYATSSRRPGDQLIYVTDHSKLTGHTGWKPRSSVSQTLALIYKFWEEHPEIFGGSRISSRVKPAFPVALCERVA
jgi:CDP-paratose 2-epimerase